MHFFRINIKRNRKSRRPPSTTNEQEESGRCVQESPSTSPSRRWRDSLWQALPFHNQVSQSIDRSIYLLINVYTRCILF